MAYLPIDHYGLIGNMRTAALVGTNGSIDWFCAPNFDSPSIFGGILDDKIGGHFIIAPENEDAFASKQMYWPDTNILITRFLGEDGILEVIDYMPVGRDLNAGIIVRTVRVIDGTIPVKMQCRPAFNYARDQHECQIFDHLVIFETESVSMGLTSSETMSIDEGTAHNLFTLQNGQEAHFTLHIIDEDRTEYDPLSDDKAQQLLDATIDYWRRWLSQCTYNGRWKEEVYRSALTLKLLTYEPTGAIVAAPTCSLPEGIGGERNWDYRYVWMRDAAFTIYAFLRIGFAEEARAFMHFLQERCMAPDGEEYPLQPLYGIDGRRTIEEETLDHLDGYMGSKPVRIGNAAYKQFQLDIFGELLDAAYLYNKYGTFISHDIWMQLHRLLDWVCENWQTTDQGVWEVRVEPTHFVYSKVMCWVALDRGIRIADKRALPANRPLLERVRDEIYNDIMENGWNEERGAFVQRYGDDALDAANLIMPLVYFVTADDPRMLSTIDEILKPLNQGGLAHGTMIYRYNLTHSPDGLQGDEGTFNMCSFWLVEALTRAGRVEQARLIFERMIGHTNHLGLFAEQTGKFGEALGNFPQAFTHLSFISAVFNLDRDI